VEQGKIERINELARKAKAEGLTPAETRERDALRREYVAAIRASLTAQLDNTYIEDGHGSRRRLKRRDKS